MNKKFVSLFLVLILASGFVGYWLGTNTNPDSIKSYQEVWLDNDITVIIVSNQTTSTDWTELDLSPYIPRGTKIVKLLLNIKIDDMGTGDYSALHVRKHGTFPAHFPEMKVDSNSLVNLKYREFVEVGVSDDSKIEYAITVGAEWQIDARIMLLGYVTET